MFTIKTCDQKVFTTKITTDKELVNEQKAHDPEAKIGYHSMHEVAGKDKMAFGIKQEHEVLFVPAYHSGEASSSQAATAQAANQSLIGAMLPTNALSTHCCEVIWAVKWATIGLIPLRPLVIFTRSGEVPPGKALSVA